MATPSDLIAPASDFVYVYWGRYDAPARRTKWAIHSEMLPFAEAGHWNKLGDAVAVKHQTPWIESGCYSSSAAQSESQCFHTWKRTRVKRARMALTAVRQLPQVPPAD